MPTTVQDTLGTVPDSSGIAINTLNALRSFSLPIKNPTTFREDTDRLKIFSPATSKVHLKENSTHLGMLMALMDGHGEYGQAAERLARELDGVYVYLNTAGEEIYDQRGILTAVDNIDATTLSFIPGDISPIFEEGKAIQCTTVCARHGYWAAVSNLLARSAEYHTEFAQNLLDMNEHTLATHFELDYEEAKLATVACLTFGVICLTHHLYKAAMDIAKMKEEELCFEHFLEVEEQGLMAMLVNYYRLVRDYTR